MHTRSGRVEYVTHLDIVGSRQPRMLGAGAAVRATSSTASCWSARVRRMAVFPAPIPPSVARFHLRVPDDVATILGAAEAHRNGPRGAGVTVAMVDSGWYRHPFFTAHGYTRRDAGDRHPGHQPGARPARARHRRVRERVRDRAGVHPAPLPGRRRPGQPGRRAGRVRPRQARRAGRADELLGRRLRRSRAGRARSRRPRARARDPGRDRAEHRRRVRRRQRQLQCRGAGPGRDRGGRRVLERGAGAPGLGLRERLPQRRGSAASTCRSCPGSWGCARARATS